MIAVLRRLGRHSDAHLRYTFLECRDRWLSAAFDEAARAGSGAAYPYLCKVRVREEEGGSLETERDSESAPRAALAVERV